MVKKTSTPIEQTSRLLDLVPYLLTHQGIAVDDLALQFGVTREIILDDLNTLWMCGLPGYTPLELIDLEFDSGFVTIRNADPLAKVRTLVGSELVALVLGIDLLLSSYIELSSTLTDRLHELSKRIREKVGRTFTITESKQSTVKAIVQLAIDQRASVRIGYFSPQSDEVKERTITPFDFFTEGSHEYLRAFCQLAGGMRTFRMDRIEEISKEFIPRQDTDSHHLTVEPITHSLRFTQGKRSTAEALGISSSEVLIGSVIPLRAYSREWLTRTVLASSGDLIIEDREESRRSIIESIDSTLALYREGAIALAPNIRN
jgi:proteasome accessory factor C